MALLNGDAQFGRPLQEAVQPVLYGDQRQWSADDADLRVPQLGEMLGDRPAPSRFPGTIVSTGRSWCATAVTRPPCAVNASSSWTSAGLPPVKPEPARTTARARCARSLATYSAWSPGSWKVPASITRSLWSRATSMTPAAMAE